MDEDYTGQPGEHWNVDPGRLSKPKEVVKPKEEPKPKPTPWVAPPIP